VTRELGHALGGAGIRLEAGGIEMLYKKINLELIVVADEADAVVAELSVGSVMGNARVATKLPDCRRLGNYPSAAVGGQLLGGVHDLPVANETGAA
jgi:hypothetical protein